MKRLFFIACLLFAHPASLFAEQIAEFSIDLRNNPEIDSVITDLMGEGKVAERADRCWSEVNVEYAGPKGRRVSTFQTEGESLLKSPQLRVEFDPAGPSRDRTFYLEEKCKHTEVIVKTCAGPDNTVVSCTETDTDHFSLKWKCSFSNAPALTRGAKTDLKCTADSYKIDSRFRRHLKEEKLKEKFLDRPYTLTLKTTHHERNAAQSLQHPRSPGKKVWIRFIEGVAGHKGENDFVYKVTIDGQEFEIAQENGTLSYDMEYLTGEPTVKISMRAIEADVFDNDEYEPENDLVLSTAAPGSQGVITMKRGTFFFEWFTSKDHQVTVVLTVDPDTLGARTAAVLGADLNDALQDREPLPGVNQEGRLKKQGPASGSSLTGGASPNVINAR